MVMAGRSPAPREEHPRRPVRLRPLPGLDGLRALAVVAVITFHLNPSWLPGGFLGVDIFFVISGYLITSLLLSEFQRHRGVALGRFWARRARRLLPAVLALLFGITVVAALFARDALGRLQGDLPASLFYVMNWRLVFEHQSYVASFGRPPLLQHLWSLSIEEQFYLIWPPALLLLRRRFSSTQVATIAISAAAVSAALMAALYNTASSVYFSTDTHAEGLLIGCALAAAIPPWRMAATVAPSAKHILERSGVVAFAVVLIGLFVFSFNSAATYRGGMVLVDLATAVVIATVAHPACRLGDLLGWAPLRWVGLRSYSLYLWHWPIFELTRPGPDLSWSTGPDDVVRLLLTVAAAELSYRYIEQPWREGRAQFALRVRMASMSRRQLVSIAVAPLLLVAVLLGTAPGPGEPPILAQGSSPAARVAPASLAIAPVTANHDPHRLPARDTTTSSPAPTTSLPPAIGPVPAASEPILAIGDSVLLAASPTLQTTFGTDITVDAAVGRQVGAGLDRLGTYYSSGAISRFRTVVIALGTNGQFTPAQFAQMAALVAHVPHVVVVDVHAARSWAAPNNSTIFAGVAAHPKQMVVADWNVAAFGPGLLYGDGIHPDPAGAAAYTTVLEQALDRVAAAPIHPAASSATTRPAPATTALRVTTTTAARSTTTRPAATTTTVKRP
ncbi:MAG TPA: acyltransferase family protein [Acidimicrobiales bacterium]|jgi:peptidoglycan/LPS O-acetylase OafA/YrhL|nr:acyltransferase family protein [Acidimicrobiales bacterium]